MAPVCPCWGGEAGGDVDAVEAHRLGEATLFPMQSSAMGLES